MLANSEEIDGAVLLPNPFITYQTFEGGQALSLGHTTRPRHKDGGPLVSGRWARSSTGEGNTEVESSRNWTLLRLSGELFLDPSLPAALEDEDLLKTHLNQRACRPGTRE